MVFQEDVPLKQFFVSGDPFSSRVGSSIQGDPEHSDGAQLQRRQLLAACSCVRQEASSNNKSLGAGDPAKG